MLAPILLGIALAAAGCSQATVYQGVVLEAATGQPLKGIQIRGGYLTNEGFSPSLDGLSPRKSKGVTTVTDEQGRFSIILEGYSRYIAVYNDRYEVEQRSLEDWPVDKAVVFRLRPRGEGTP
jgi:hypothetical protein